MKYYYGIPVSPGVAIGLVTVLANNRASVRRRQIDPSQTPSELQRLDDAFESAQAAIMKSRDEATEQIGEQYGKIFDAHLMFLQDPSLRQKIEDAIKNEHVSAEYAAATAFDYYAQRLRSLPDATYAERASDVADVKDCLLSELTLVARGDEVESDQRSILATSFLAPSEAAKLDPEKTLAIITENGGRGSHTAIVASALGIPTVVGLGSFLCDVYDNSLAIVDGDKGQLILDPTLDVVEEYQSKLDALQRERQRRRQMSRKLYAATTDGFEIAVEANIEFPYEARKCIEYGAAGIGLYRTEFLYLTETNGVLPDEETHFKAYREVLSTMGHDRLTVIRTFDLGADKLPEGRSFVREKEPNPFMGLRSVRLSLRRTDMFREQLRAILRASVYGKVAVMFPLVTTIREWRQAKMIFRDVCEEFVERDAPFDSNIPLGMMVETPAAVVMLDQFASEVDFFSIGTNDLLQYTQAVDRSNKEVNSLYAQESPALLRFIRHTIEVANTYGRPTAVCGQMASVPANVPLLLGLGLRALSVAPERILETKEICEWFSIEECETIARQALMLETADDVRAYLREQFNKKKAEVAKSEDASTSDAAT